MSKNYQFRKYYNVKIYHMRNKEYKMMFICSFSYFVIIIYYLDYCNK